jgi:hypothetical protein
MHLERQFDVALERDDVVEKLSHEDTLLSLFQNGESEIADRKGDRITIRTHYTALGREGVATFHFDFLMDGNIRFEKVCDGRVWKSLHGEVEIEERGSGTRVGLTLDGATKALVPEFTIKGPMEEQIEEMVAAMSARLA